MRTDDFNFDLPESLIAQYPTSLRGASRLFVLDRKRQGHTDSRVSEIGDFLEPGTVMVFNDSKVRKARALRHRRGYGREGGVPPPFPRGRSGRSGEWIKRLDRHVQQGEATKDRQVLSLSRAGLRGGLPQSARDEKGRRVRRSRRRCLSRQERAYAASTLHKARRRGFRRRTVSDHLRQDDGVGGLPDGGGCISRRVSSIP